MRTLDRTLLYDGSDGELVGWDEDSHCWEVMSAAGNLIGVYYTDDALLNDFPDLSE